MNSPTKIIGVLTVMGLLSGGLLAGVYKISAPLIEKNRLEALKKAIFVVLPDAKNYNKVEKTGTVVYEGINESGEPVGTAFEAKGSGFQGKITMMVGIDNQFKTLKGMLVLDQVETPGLGNKISKDSFQNQFKGLATEPKITYIKNRKSSKPYEIEAITAATVSTKAVVDILNSKISKTKKVLGR